MSSIALDIISIQQHLENKGEIILYQPDGTLKLEVRLEDETVWLTQSQIAELLAQKYLLYQNI